jgi:hypothetical protein
LATSEGFRRKTPNMVCNETELVEAPSRDLSTTKYADSVLTEFFEESIGSVTSSLSVTLTV